MCLAIIHHVIFGLYIFKTLKSKFLNFSKGHKETNFVDKLFLQKLAFLPQIFPSTYYTILANPFQNYRRKKLQRIKIFHTFVAKNVLVCKELCMHTRLALWKRPWRKNMILHFQKIWNITLCKHCFPFSAIIFALKCNDYTKSKYFVTFFKLQHLATLAFTSIVVCRT